MIVQHKASRNLNITGKTVTKSSIFSSLTNHYSNKDGKNKEEIAAPMLFKFFFTFIGIVYLTSKDVNTLARSIMRVIAVEEEVTSNYIPSKQEHEIIHELLGVVSDQKVQSNEFTKDEWNSVFWDDIFSRPDIQSEYSNEVFKYDETKNQFKYNATKDHEFREKTEARFNKESQTGKSRKGGFSWKKFGRN